MNEVDIAEAPARKRDAPRTKAAILQAAKEAFSTQGYAQTGIRGLEWELTLLNWTTHVRLGLGGESCNEPL